MSLNLVVTTPHISLDADASAWAKGMSGGVSYGTPEAVYADEAVVRRSAGVADYNLEIEIPAETSTHAASAALWPLLGTKVDVETRASDAVVGASNPQFNNLASNTSKAIVAGMSFNFTAGENAQVGATLAMDGSLERATA